MSDDPFEEYDPYKSTTIEKLLREYNDDDLQKSGDSHLILKQKLESITLDIWDMSMKNARNRDSQTVEEEDIINAFNKVFYPYTLLEEAAVTMGEYEKEFRKTAAKAKLTDIEVNEDD
ncbi:hypothetical protein [Halovivax gelatinilyticus]|uniref:hypothetical protein n=1 Tax=Halovivax gelatinilyticus TaxID=2961597 RepID=UPI0020CA3A99|nr:hypothetical protein [Halovivax gelatinilyticus]